MQKAYIKSKGVLYNYRICCLFIKDISLKRDSIAQNQQDFTLQQHNNVKHRPTKMSEKF